MNHLPASPGDASQPVPSFEEMGLPRKVIAALWQLIDDMRAATVVAASDLEVGGDSPIEKAKAVGELIATKAKDAGIRAVVFDRGGRLYHGRVAAVAEGAREGGLQI